MRVKPKQSRLKELFIYDPDSGEFTRKHAHNRWKSGGKVGFLNTSGYIEAGVDNAYYQISHLAWIYVHGDADFLEIDHINGIKTDNRISNLRPSNRAMNCQNIRKPQSNSKSGYLGVSFHKSSNKWVAQISFSGKKIHIGCFDSPEKASEAYINKKREIHQGCTL